MSDYPLSELLMGIAQISIAFVGFSAIVEVVRDRTQHERSQFENMLARTMIEFGFQALFLALLPLIVFRYVPDHSNSIWHALLALAVIVLVGEFVVYRRRRGRIAKSTFLMPRVFLGWASANALVALGAMASLAGLFPIDAAYVATLVWLLISGSISFVVIVSVLE